MSNDKGRNNFIYTNHVKERMQERSINKEDVKLAIRNPDYEEKCGGSIKSFRVLGIISGKIKRELVVIWRWGGKDQIIIQTAYYNFRKFN